MAFVGSHLSISVAGISSRWCDRRAYCLLGLPFDAVSMAEALAVVEAAVADQRRCFLSTPNLNFLIAANQDAKFRESVINSDLSVADGMPLVWVAKLLGLPIRERVAGSGLFEKLRTQTGRKISVFLFGGMPGVAADAERKLIAENSRLVCSGSHDPGFVSVDEMSSPEVIAKINQSQADFLLLALGAKKGQFWIERNRASLQVPVLSHLGAVLNFVAGTVSRAPLWVQRSGLEWLWRIKEEPALWRRYWGDGVAFLRLLFQRVLPYAVFLRSHQRRPADAGCSVERLPSGSLRLILRGAWSESTLPPLREALAAGLDAGCRSMEISLQDTTYVDSAWLGLILLLRKELNAVGGCVSLTGVKPVLRRIFYWNGAEYLLEQSPQSLKTSE